MSQPGQPIHVHDFQRKWRTATERAVNERAAAQEHFIDLCRMLGQATPNERDPQVFRFEKGLAKAGGGQGFADVWYLNHFAWEYKGPHKDLDAAYKQLLLYKDDLQNPPLLVVSDLHRFQVHTNFTGTVKKVHEFTLDDLDRPEFLRVLRALFEEPLALRPRETPEGVTREVAERFAMIAQRLHARGVEPQRAAHFLVQVLFCLFAEDIGLLPGRLFTRIAEFCAQHPDEFPTQAAALFHAMRAGGIVALEDVPRFNGGLFATVDVLPLEREELTLLATTARSDWRSIEPSIFGTLFERSLDPAKRA